MLRWRIIQKTIQGAERKLDGCDTTSSPSFSGVIIIDVYDFIMFIFKGSLKEAVFIEKLKIAKFIPVFKKDKK